MSKTTSPKAVEWQLNRIASVLEEIRDLFSEAFAKQILETRNS